MYCVKCGVELADSQRVCPLCGTRVFHPDICLLYTSAPLPTRPIPRMSGSTRRR